MNHGNETVDEWVHSYLSDLIIDVLKMFHNVGLQSTQHRNNSLQSNKNTYTHVSFTFTIANLDVTESGILTVS